MSLPRQSWRLNVLGRRKKAPAAAHGGSWRQFNVRCLIDNGNQQGKQCCGIVILRRWCASSITKVINCIYSCLQLMLQILALFAKFHHFRFAFRDPTTWWRMNYRGVQWTAAIDSSSRAGFVIWTPFWARTRRIDLPVSCLY